MKLPFLLLALIPLSFAFADDARPAAIPLWSQDAPDSEARAVEPEKIDGSNVHNVHNPSITPFSPTKDATASR